MKKFFKKHSREFVFAGVIMLCICLIGIIMILVNEYSASLGEQVETKVALYANDTTNLLNANLSLLEQQTVYAVRRFSEADNADELIATYQELKEETYFADLTDYRYFKDGLEYDLNDSLYTEKESPVVLAALEKNELTLAGLVFDAGSGQNKIVFCAPVENNSYIQKLILIYSVNYVRGFSDDADSERLAHSKYVALCSSSGEVISMLYNPESFIPSNANVVDEMWNKTGSSESVDELERLIANGKGGTFSCRVSGEQYVVSVGVSERSSSLCIVGMYRACDVSSAGYDLVNIIFTALVVLCLVLISFAVYFIIHENVTKRKLQEYGTFDEHLNCPTSVMFNREAAQIIERYKGTKYAVVAVEIRYYKYLTDTYGATVADEILKYMRFIYSKMLLAGETYAHVSESTFVLLLHYKDEEALMGRLRAVYALAYENQTAREYNIKLAFGIYLVENGMQGVSITDMTDKAMLAKNSKELNAVGESYHIYKDVLLEGYMQNADIESRMETALKDGEFIVFYQPKYDVGQDRIDSCEALVRWYDPEHDEYRLPALFLPLFETNGFIVELDHYVYCHVCEFIKKRVDAGQKIVPISVNVSRVTAIQDGFTDYYIAGKKRYGIADNFIVLEFTESVAYENYEVLHTIAKTLHNAGFLTSIDDFGTGYSSYNLLKMMRMDEIKLDKFFLEDGLSKERDRKILENVISVSKALDMTVVQEGVSTFDTVEYLRTVGCDVIQGYIYSKPLCEKDFIKFIDRPNTGMGAPVL